MRLLSLRLPDRQHPHKLEMAEPQDMLESDGAPGYLAAVTLVSEAYTTLQGILETC